MARVAPRSLYRDDAALDQPRQPGVSMLDDIYNNKILELAGNIPRIGRLADPDATARAHSRLCGSTVTVDLKVAEGRVSDFAHDVRSEEHTSELQSPCNLVCRLLLEKK